MSDILASDALLIVALLIPVAVMAFRARLSLLSSILSQDNSQSSGPLSLQVALESFASYWSLSHAELSRMRAAYGRLPYASRKLGYDIGYPQKLKRLEDCISVNSILTRAISEFGKEYYGDNSAYGWIPAVSPGARGSSDLGRVREVLKHFVRDWSEESKAERDKTLQPILDILIEEGGKGKRAFVPGCGLGRLAWEISELGYDTTALDYSSFMTLSLRFLLSPQETTQPNRHILHPYSHWFSHQRSNDDLFRAVKFPDVTPRLQEGKFSVLEGDFFQHDPKSDEARYDYVVTLFFIDTSLDIFKTVAHIHRLLRSGGRWINLGPLLWTGGGVTGAELGLEEILEVVRRSGFELDEGTSSACSRRTIDCEYTADKRALMSWIYHAQLWVARKID